MPDFLLEVGTEELPASYIAPALAQIVEGLRTGLEKARLTCGQPRTGATPRRLAAWLPAIPAQQGDVEVEVMGPPSRAAFDAAGKPTKAAEGFAKSQGVQVSDIVRVETPRGEYCMVRRREKGRPAIDILAALTPQVLQSVSFPKSMRWPGAKQTFARPVRWLVALFGRDLTPCEAFGVRANRVTEGHPFLASGDIRLESADWDAYCHALRKARVMVDVGERREHIRRGIEAALRPFGGRLEETDLLEEVVEIVQFPHVILGSFDRQFLDVPAPAVIAAMTEHQRYFPVRDGRGALCPHFLVVSDRGGMGDATIRGGNERVLRARLSDARFFYEQDRSRRFEDYVGGTEGMVFLKGIGSYRDKTNRLARLVKAVCARMGYDAGVEAVAARAASLCKADLVTAMVGEFPKLQGVMGGIYADEDGEPKGVGQAIAEHYMPRSADDGLPVSDPGRALGLAEKIDNICACFALGLVPTGSQDPYALRRQSQAVLRMVREAGRFIRLGELVDAGLALLPDKADKSSEARERILGFLRDRLQQTALDEGIPHDLVQAALAVSPDDVADFWLRLTALVSLAREPVWPALVTVAERTCNISRDAPDGPVDPGLFEYPEESRLWEVYQAQRDEIVGLEERRDYPAACRRFAEVFAEPVHAFFDRVFVNVEDAQVRANRLRLVLAVHRLFGGRVADLSRITTGVTK